MPSVTIDGTRTEVPQGATILDAARQLGIDVPTLCHLDGYRPSTSCLVCVVKVQGKARMVPSCATLVTDGMVVESETPEVHATRRMALELLLSDHLGDCMAPCQLACPVGMDIPLMLRQIREGDWHEAIATIKSDMALPAVLGRVCGKPCEKGCRRSVADGAVAICRLKAQAAEHDLAANEPYLPSKKSNTGKTVAIIGGGPSGLAAAYYLAQLGHRVTLHDDQSELGGRLRSEFDSETLPAELLDAEIAQIVRLGIDVKLEACIDDAKAFKRLCDSNDAVLIASGEVAKQLAEQWGVATTSRGIEVARGAFQTSMPGVFAAGRAVRSKGPVVRDVADGKQASAAIDAFLMGSAVDTSQPFNVRMGRLPAEEVAALIEDNEGCVKMGATGVSPVPNKSSHPQEVDTNSPLDPAFEQAEHEAARCLHCDCRGLETCRLKRYAQQYDAQPKRYSGTRRKLIVQRAASGLIFEPGKCIDCGLCIQVAERQREVLGLTFIGRGFDVRVGVPLDRTLDEALGKLAAECAAVCPTAALTMGTPRVESELPILGQS